MGNLVLQKVIEQKIFVIRGKKVMLDKDLAQPYFDVPKWNIKMGWRGVRE